ncbi:lccl domain containing protein [Lentinula edodes]|uniref:Lccl domain containing protein n=2 Tax=Lentinula edodes TaxID=5353 RepID=A0A1Q3EFS0_LENED|nr:lccl domain containing protein [Lentinula edodes]
MFLNGAAAFGLDSILQTPAELVQDAPLGTTLPIFLTNSTSYNVSIPFENQTIFWDALPAGWDGFSLLVDDVERYVGTALNFSLAAFNASLPHFFRLALTSSGNTGDFTMPATLFPNGTWIDPAPGSST